MAIRAADFFREEAGQDMVEYTLLLAFLVLASAALYLGMNDSINGIWTGISSRLADAN